MWPWFLSVSVATALGGVVAGTLTAPFDRSRRGALWVNHWLWGRLLFALGPLWRVERQRVPDGDAPLGPGPYVVVSNHTSLLDIPLNMGLPLPMRVSARPGLFRVPIMGRYMRYSRMISVDAGSREAVEASLAACRQAIAEGVSILVFPEGTRSEDGRIGAFHKGAFLIARELDVPILPVVIDGSGAALPKGRLGLMSSFCRFRMRTLPPVAPATSARVLSRQIRADMVAELDRMRSGDAESPA